MNDFTGTISAADASAINALCAQIEMNTSTQIAVLMVNSTSPYEIADYSVRTAEQNGIGKEKLDNGILMVIAKGDRAWWVSVGYGLEGDLPDGKVGEIGRSYLVPALKSGEYGQGILDTINRMGMAIGAIPPEPEPDNSAFVCIVVILLIIIFIIVVRASIAASKSGKGGNKGSGIGGGIMGGMIGGGFRGGGFGGSGGFGGGGFGGGSFGGGGAGGKF
ncbi:MAG: TPM domain-containing protein [Candidatus Micrarchaeia archaeon]